MNFYSNTVKIDNSIETNTLNWNQYEQSANELCASLPIDMDTLIPNMEVLDQVDHHHHHHHHQNTISSNDLVQSAANQDFTGLFIVQPTIDLLNYQNSLTNNYASLQNYKAYVNNYTNDSNLNVNNQSTENVSKVDLLNQAISSVNKHDIKLPTYVPHASENTYNEDQKPKLGKPKNFNKIKCSVCGNPSSGYHYGAHTCEACKLFFRRAEKQIRKTGFPECPRKNCLITSESRASCANCRYKKCIAAGMSMSRSRYGRRTATISSSYTPNMSEVLCYELNKVKNEAMKDQLVTIEALNNLIVDFYMKSLSILNNVEAVSNSNSSSSDMDVNDYSYASDSPMSEFSSQTSAASSKTLPSATIVLFCVMFDLKSKLLNAIAFDKMIQDYEDFFQFVKNQILVNKELVPMLKIGIFIKVLRVLFEKIPVKDHPVDKRISDLMRSEFACSKSNPNDSSNYALLLSQLNHILFKHMTEYEIQTFLTLPKEGNN